MIASMTGFAAATREIAGGQLAVELKSVNHRYLEFQCRLADDLRALRWGKLVWNASFNPVTALARTTVGETLDDPRLLALVRSAMEEVVAVARAAGVRLRDDVVERSLDVRPDFREALTSMHQDVLRGRPTEAGAILGEVLRHAADRGIAVPVLLALHALCSARGAKAV